MHVAVVEFPETRVLYAAASGDWHTIPQAASHAFAKLEAALPPSGRKMFGYWHPPALEYRACYQVESGDKPEELGLDLGVLAAGLYRRTRLKGVDVFARIPAAFKALEALGELADDGRPWLEVYRRHDEVDVLVPLAARRVRRSRGTSFR